MKTSAIAVYLLLLEYVYANVIEEKTQEKTPSFTYAQAGLEDEKSSRYLVRFKKGSAMMSHTANAASPNNVHSSSGAVRYLPKEDIAVMDLESINDVEYWETRDDVEAVELGMLMNIINST